jgi:hypothetical protein
VTVAATTFFVLSIGGSLIGIDRWHSARVVRAYKLKKLTEQEDVEQTAARSSEDELTLTDRQMLVEILSRTRPNGGTSNYVGDVVKRTEDIAVDTHEMVEGLRTDFDRHLGWAEAIVARMDGEIGFVRQRERDLELRLARGE